MEDFCCVVKYFIIFLLITCNSRIECLQAIPNQHIADLLKRSNIERKQFDVKALYNDSYIYTNLDEYRGLQDVVRTMDLQFTKRFENQLYSDNRRRGKFQKRFNFTKGFPCSLEDGRSQEVPISVHRLRPGDIDIVAAMGDSVTAGTNIVSNFLFHLLTEFRGLSFSGGGQGEWHQYLTLPNILKLYNPKLYGYASETSLNTQRASRFNVGEPIAMTRDLIYQAYVLIERLRHDRKVDMSKHWKLITIFIGNNDVCSDICAYDNRQRYLQKHREQLIETLTILRDNVPRLVINLITIPNVVKTIASLTRRPLLCYITCTMFCSCIVGERFNSTYLENMSKLIEEWQQIDQQIANLKEFQRQDFAVIFQPFLVNVTLKYLEKDIVDYRYFSDDCIHFSQFGHATLANALWNNMLQKTGSKQQDLYEAFERFECPTAEHPYIVTN